MRFNLSVFLFVAVSAVLAFAQQAEVDEPVLQEYCSRCNVYEMRPYMPYGLTAEIAYAGPTVLSMQLLGYRNFYIRHKVLVGFPLVAADIDFDEWNEGWKISDEGILGLILFLGSIGYDDNFVIWLDYLLFGNTYYPLTEDASIGLFETHHIVDYLIYDTSLGKPWEFGFSEAAGVRIVYSKSRTGDKSYLDLGANVRLTNKASRIGVFVQLGLSGTHT